jgi:uncharacterized membrane-anchored protein
MLGVASAEKAAPAKKAPATKSAKAPAKAPAKDAKPAEDTDVPTDDGSAAEAEPQPTPEEIEAALPPHVKGPKLVDLGDGTEVDLPAGMILFEAVEAKKLIEEGGGRGDRVKALIGTMDSEWEVIVEYDDVGYVTDKDADQLDSNELLDSYKQGTEQGNITRRAKGIPELFVDSWSENPRYERASHHLLWGLNAHTVEGPVINYFTRILGRNGFLSVNLIDSPDHLAAAKQETAALVSGIRFQTGSAYEDHVESDKSSGMGLRALVIGGTGLAVMKVAKAGILIKLLLIFKKGFIVVFAAIGGFFKWMLGRKKKNADAEPPQDPPPADEPPATPPEV